MEQYRLLTRLIKTCKTFGSILEEYKAGYDELIDKGYSEEEAQGDMDSELLSLVIEHQVKDYCEILAETIDEEYKEFIQLNDDL